jgi:hypothetical protein
MRRLSRRHHRPHRPLALPPPPAPPFAPLPLLVSLHPLTHFSTCTQHDHVAVNTLQAMSDGSQVIVVNKIGDGRLAELAAVQSGAQGKLYHENKEKYHTNVYQKKSPVAHFILRITHFFARCSPKHWGKFVGFAEFILVFDAEQHKLADEDDPELEVEADPELKLDDGERWVLQGLMAIRGSRNGVFFINPVALCIWWSRAFKYLTYLDKLAKARGDKVGGFTRRYLIECMGEPAIKAEVHARAFVCLTFFYPFMSHVHHVEDVAEDLPTLDQATYKVGFHALPLPSPLTLLPPPPSPSPPCALATD